MLRMDPSNRMDTLDEPVSATLLRDLTSIKTKLKFILIPMNTTAVYKNVLKDWDLWGPLIICTTLSLFLHHKEEADNGVGANFAEIFVLLWLGSWVVSLNYRLLALSTTQQTQQGDSLVAAAGAAATPTSDSIPTSPMASPSLFQLMCVLGYCMAPGVLGVLLISATGLIFGLTPSEMFVEKLLVGSLCGFVWPTLSAHKVLQRYQSRDKLILSIYPVGLLYLVLAWMMISAH